MRWIKIPPQDFPLKMQGDLCARGGAYLRDTTVVSGVHKLAYTSISTPQYSGGLRQAFIAVQTMCHRKLMVYFADKKSTIGFCFVSCYCIVVDDVNKQIGFHGNAPPSCKQRQLIKAALTLFQLARCQVFLITRQSWYCSNVRPTQNSELTGNWVW